MLRLLHLADIHFDATFRCRSEGLRAKLREAIRVAFVRGIDTAIKEKVDAVLVAGDLFDGERFGFPTEKTLVDQFERLHAESIQVFYACGNHDPSSLRSRVGSLSLPDNCIVFSSATPEEHVIRSSDGVTKGVVVGAGHESAHEERNIAATFPAATGDFPYVGLLHTMVTTAKNAETHDRYAPCSLEDMTKLGYDYWALGHVHVRQAVDVDERVWYPGNIQGRNPRETGAKGGLLVDVQKGLSPEVRFVSLAPVEWVAIRIGGLSTVKNLVDLERLVAESFLPHRDSVAGDEFVVVMDLEGDCPMADDLRSRESVDELESMLADHLDVASVELRVTNLHKPIDVSAYAGEPHVLGELLRLLSRLDEAPGLIERIAPPELAHSVPSDEERSAYLYDLLEGLDREAVLRLADSA